MIARSLFGNHHMAALSTHLPTDAFAEEVCLGCQFLWLDNSVESTQDEAKRRVPLPAGIDLFAVAASAQLKGRGTRGRDWIGEPGNLFLTLTVPMARIPSAMTLTPLKVGTVVARSVETALTNAEGCEKSRVTLKWPNDVLVDEKKVSGVLVEGDGAHLFIGIGVNVGTAPDVPKEGAQQGRPSTCLAQHGLVSSPEVVKSLARDITKQLWSWIKQGPAAGGNGTTHEEVIRREWSEYVDWKRELTLRDNSATRVVPLRLETDGELRVRNVVDGTEQVLVAEYLH